MCPHIALQGWGKMLGIRSTTVLTSVTEGTVEFSSGISQPQGYGKGEVCVLPPAPSEAQVLIKSN